MVALLNDNSHLRKNILTGEWVLVSPHRSKRPWLGAVEKGGAHVLCEYDENCYLCPTNTRSSGIKNPDYKSAFAFDNDFSALLQIENESSINENDLLVAKSENGVCKVICFSPHHDLTLSTMEIENIVDVVKLWKQETLELGIRDDITNIQIFENKGAIMGCSNPHPHCQIWATKSLTNEVAKEIESQKSYYESHNNSCLLCDYLQLEIKKDERTVLENEHFVVMIPYWAYWPFELLLLSKRHMASFLDLTIKEERALADILNKISIKYDNLFECSFPYAMGFHQRPFDGLAYDEFHFHAHFYPPLLRSSSVKKFMAGFELLGTLQRDITPEIAAERLKGLDKELWSNCL